MLIVIAGDPGSGKTTLATDICRLIGACCTEVDVVRAALDHTGATGLPDLDDIAVVAVLALARVQLQLGHRVVLTCDNTAKLYALWAQLTAEEQVPIRWVQVHCPDAGELRRRRGRPAAAAPPRGPTFTTHTLQGVGAGRGSHLVVDSTDNRDWNARRVLDRLVNSARPVEDIPLP